MTRAEVHDGGRVGGEAGVFRFIYGFAFLGLADMVRKIVDCFIAVVFFLFLTLFLGIWEW